MTIKVYVDFDNETVMTEAEHKAWAKETVDDLMLDEDKIENVLYEMDISRSELFTMDNDDRNELTQRVRDYFAEGLDDDYHVREFKVEV